MSITAITSADVRAALREYFPSPRCGICFEVAQGTGSRAHRHIDAIAMDLWPSHGLGIHGIEIKSYRGDWLRELKTPEKAEQLARFCDYFWVAAPAGIIKVDEMPTAWGLLELANGKLKKAKAAEKTACSAIDRNFMAAMIRASQRSITQTEIDTILNQHKEKLTQELRETYARRIEEEAARKTRENSGDAEHWRKLCAEIDENYLTDKEVIAAIKVIIKAGVVGAYGGIDSLANSLERSLTEIREAQVFFKPIKESEPA